MGRFPSGQREQTVNLPLLASVVRIHPCPPYLREWRNWQTRMIQVHVYVRTCRFKSCFPHVRALEKSRALFHTYLCRTYEGIERRKKLVCPIGTNKFIDDADPADEPVRPDQTASGGIGGFGPKYFSISALLRPKAFFVKSHSRVGRFRITFRRRSTRFCQYL